MSATKQLSFDFKEGLTEADILRSIDLLNEADLRYSFTTSEQAYMQTLTPRQLRWLGHWMREGERIYDPNPRN